jgi:hypothetical protein
MLQFLSKKVHVAILMTNDIVDAFQGQHKRTLESAGRERSEEQRCSRD